jgi:hypothetical protein
MNNLKSVKDTVVDHFDEVLTLVVWNNVIPLYNFVSWDNNMWCILSLPLSIDIKGKMNDD